MVRIVCPKCGKSGSLLSRRVSCGRYCDKCPHGPYIYVGHYISPGKVKWCYINERIAKDYGIAICHSCGSVNIGATNFCSSCGAKLGVAIEVHDSQPTTNQNV